jgi:hypothetical protein
MKYTLGILPLTVEHFLRWHVTYEGVKDEFLTRLKFHSGHLPDFLMRRFLIASHINRARCRPGWH